MNPERQTPKEHSSAELEAAARQQVEKLSNRSETGQEKFAETHAEKVERARQAAKEVFSKESGREKASGGEPDGRTVRRATAKQKQAHYQSTMKHIQSEMSVSSRTFSKVIHNPAVEKTSQAVAATAARPNAILAGSLSAFIIVLILYLVTKHYGYVLSGFETIGAFVIGWILGLIYDYARVSWVGRG